MSKKRGNGEGSITKRKDGRWMARYTVHTANGPKRRHIYGRTRQEVAAMLAKAMIDRDGGIELDPSSVTVNEYLQRWLNDSARLAGIQMGARGKGTKSSAARRGD